jgi:hypothetical protein
MKLGELKILVPLALAALTGLPAAASTIQLGINGDAQIGSNFIDFGQYPAGAPYSAAPDYGTFEVSLVNAGVFESDGVTTGEFGDIQSLDEGTGPVVLPSAFMTFDTGGSNLQLWVTDIPAGAVGPFTFTDTPFGAIASFDVDGYVLDTNTNTMVDTFDGTFSATFAGQTVASLFTDLPINTPFSATFTATVNPTAAPEPAYASLFGFGLLGIALVWRQKVQAGKSA